MTIHIYAPPGYSYRTIQRCPTCDRRRRMVVTIYSWFGADTVCCGCGESWNEESRCERPFERGWRKRAVTGAKKLWNRATTKSEALDALMVEIRAEETVSSIPLAPAKEARRNENP